MMPRALAVLRLIASSNLADVTAWRLECEKMSTIENGKTKRFSLGIDPQNQIYFGGWSLRKLEDVIRQPSERDVEDVIQPQSEYDVEKFFDLSYGKTFFIGFIFDPVL